MQMALGILRKRTFPDCHVSVLTSKRPYLAIEIMVYTKREPEREKIHGINLLHRLTRFSRVPIKISFAAHLKHSSFWRTADAKPTLNDLMHVMS